jgi:tRNA dimethylallyltransferase
MNELPLLILAGPTAAGKSAAALRVAKTVGREVVNADSMQVYRELRILSARPGEAETGGVPHRLFGHVDAAERYSVGRYLEEARAVVADARASGRTPVVVGGTGLYLRALTKGLSAVPPVPAEVEAEGAALLAADLEGFRRDLFAHDPASADLRPTDTQRLLRAWSVAKATGRTLSDWQREEPVPGLPGPVRAVVLAPPRDALYARIERRWDAMMAAGALEEAEALHARGLPPDLPVMKALGVAPLIGRLRGELDADEADALAKRDTRRYAKRQLTWFRHQTGWPWAETEEDAVRLVLALPPAPDAR